MQPLSLENKIKALPEELKSEVMDFIDFLLLRYKNNDFKQDTGFGCLKGKIEMTDDFDEPLEEFKEYME
jgi:hypothetical protein